jgi:hypothetical protein
MIKKHILIICFSLFITTLFSQENKQELVWFDSLINQKNLPINQGVIFSEKHRTFNKNHHFLFENTFFKGNLKYNNQMYYNVSMKYDTYNDNLILKINSITENFHVILNKELISSFQLNNKTFYNINLSGFYEVIYKSESGTLVRKHFSKRKAIKEEDFFYSDFTHEETVLLHKNNKFHVLKKKKHFHKIFPNKKKMITDFFKMNKRENENNNTAFILNLIKKLNNE